MKNLIKSLFGIMISFNLYACNNVFEPEFPVEGKWENTMKNSDGSSLVSELDIKTKTETKNNKKETFFDAVLNMKVTGSQSETLKIPTTKLSFTGKVDKLVKRLIITDVESETSTYKEGSYLILSDNSGYITLYPGEIKFKKK